MCKRRCVAQYYSTTVAQCSKNDAELLKHNKMDAVQLEYYCSTTLVFSTAAVQHSFFCRAKTAGFFFCKDILVSAFTVGDD